MNAPDMDRSALAPSAAPSPDTAGAATPLIHIEPILADCDDAEELCQIDSAMHGGTMRRPGFLYIFKRIKTNLHERGFLYTLKVTLKGRIESARTLVYGPPPVRPTPFVPGRSP